MTSEKRFALTLDLPTASESGLPGFKTSAWQGFPAPAATPRQIIQKLNGETVSMLTQPSMRERLSQMGADAVGNSPEAFWMYVKNQIAKWPKVVRAACIKAD